MCELGDPNCQWGPGLPEGEHEICREHWVRRGAQFTGRVDRQHSPLTAEDVLAVVGVLVILTVTAMVVVTFW